MGFQVRTLREWIDLWISFPRKSLYGKRQMGLYNYTNSIIRTRVKWPTINWDLAIYTIHLLVIWQLVYISLGFKQFSESWDWINSKFAKNSLEIMKVTMKSLGILENSNNSLKSSKCSFPTIRSIGMSCTLLM